MAEKKPQIANRENLIESVGTKTRNLTQKEALLLQEPFLAALKVQMEKDGLTPPLLAKKLGMAYSYIASLTGGTRMIANSERARIETFAEYLNVPVVQIYIWGGLLGPRDFIIRKDLDSTLDNIFQIMESDPALTSIVPTKKEWTDKKLFSERAKLFAAQIFELFSNKMMLERATLDKPKTKSATPKHILSRS